MSSPIQPESTTSQSMSCCSLRGDKLPVARHVEGAIAEPCIEVLGPDLVSNARHVRVVQLVAVAVKGHGGEAVTLVGFSLEPQ